MPNGQRNEFNPNFIAIAVITFYPKWYNGKLQSISHIDKIRGDLGLEFIKKATSLGYQVVVVDGKSSKSFRKVLKSFTKIKLIARRGYKRSPAKRQAFKTAAKLPEVKVIIATEPEKVSIIDHIQKITQPILDNQADIVIPQREDRLFKETYPSYMYESEIEGNRLFNEQLRLFNILQNSQDFDFYFGPRVFVNTKKLLSLFIKTYYFQIESQIFSKEYFDSEEYANAQFFPIVLALKKGLRILNIKIPFSYPKLQKENETSGAGDYFTEKRRSQSLGILLQLMHLLNYFMKK